jgi:hypothetical protein
VAQLAPNLGAKLLELELHERVLVLFEFVKMKGHNFFLQLRSIHFHLEADRSLRTDSELLIELSKGIEDVFWCFEEERKLTVLLNVGRIDVELIVFGGMLAFELKNEHFFDFLMLEVKFDIEGAVLCSEATLALLQLVADHSDSNI